MRDQEEDGAVTDIETLARRIAEEAHSGQLDKAGAPYLGHVRRVVDQLDDPLDRAVAWLHDVLEDTDWTTDELYGAGQAAHPARWPVVVGNVSMLTHRRDEPRSAYYARVRDSHRAVRVKLADVADNSDPERLALLDEATRKRLTEKYAKAREALTGVRS